MDTLRGSVDRINYNNPNNGYTVLVVKADAVHSVPKVNGFVTVVGVLPDLSQGMELEFIGAWIEDPKYGRQFKAERCTPAAPSSREGLVAYLGGGLVKGIGPKTAENIVRFLGKDALNILDRDPDRLFDVPKLKRDHAEKLIMAWRQGQQSRRALIELQDMGISGAMASRIIKDLGAESPKIVRDNPYTLADEVYGYGFMRADTVARGLGVTDDDPNRIRAGLRYTLNQAAFDGHVYLPRGVLIERAGEALRVENPSLVETLIAQEVFHDRLMIDGDATSIDAAVYTPEFFEAETNAASMLHKLATSPSPIAPKAADAIDDGLFKTLAKTYQLSLSEQQGEAVAAALMNKVTVLTGGPGTGKTTTLRAVIHALESLEQSFMLASPTGRAAKRLGEATGRQALTIHRLLGYFPNTGEFLHDETNPLDIAMLVLDETSMLDLMLFDAVLRALKPEAHLMLVGDVDQLPSVGAGNVLKDVIDGGVAHVTRLQTIFRQAEGSRIIANAHRINAGEEPLLDNPPGDNDFFFFSAEDPERAGDLIVDIVVNRLPSKFGVDPVRDVQVIAPMYKGAAGVDALNAKLQAALNPSRGMPEYKSGMKVLRVGDKVMQTKNNYDLDVFNGDIGYLLEIDRENAGIGVEMDTGEVFYELNQAEQLIHAYCISTHRSQGSEYPVVVMPILTGQYMMLQRNLLYTAVTRARQMVVLVGSKKAVAIAVGNDRVTERYSGLKARLRAKVRR
ncbi:MAG: ATP-dependent RecD-like DNA helicase [Chloroflexota bacterium]|nr:ATP-dependent RecD-like DNA helicase [Chloroflexota bacterium]